MDCLDTAYAEFLLAQIWKVKIDFKIFPDNVLGMLDFAYNDEILAHTAAYYFIYRLKNTKILISLNISKENELTIILDCKDFDKKIVCKTKQYAHFELANHISSGKIPYDTTRILISFHYPKSRSEPDTLPIIISRESPEMPLACISGLLYTFGNEGLELHYEELPPF
jgi:hypothetical protein